MFTESTARGRLNRVGGHEAGAAVLVRALEPTHGLALDERPARRCDEVRKLCSDEGKLYQALPVTGAQNGAPLNQPPFDLSPRTQLVEVACGPRVGFTKGAQTPWRFCWRGSAFLSKPFGTR